MNGLFEDPFNPPALGDEGFDEEYLRASARRRAIYESSLVMLSREVSHELLRQAW